MTKIANYLLKEKNSLKFFYIIIVLTVMISFFYSTQIAQASDDRRISVLYFNDSTGQPGWDWLSKDFTDMLIKDLSQVDTLVCSSSQDIEDLYYKFGLSPVKGEIDKSLLIQFIDNLNTELIFFGYFYLSSPSTLNLGLKKYDSSTGEITAFRDFIAENTDTVNLKDKVVSFILKELNVELPIQKELNVELPIQKELNVELPIQKELNVELPIQDEDKSQVIPTTSLDDLSNYNKCLDLMDKAIVEYKGVDYPSKKLWAEAIEYGERAVAEDPKFAEAYYLLAEIYNRTHWTIKEVDSLSSFIQLVEDNHLESKDIYKKASQAYFRLGYAFYSC